MYFTLLQWVKTLYYDLLSSICVNFFIVCVHALRNCNLTLASVGIIVTLMILSDEHGIHSCMQVTPCNLVVNAFNELCLFLGIT